MFGVLEEWMVVNEFVRFGVFVVVFGFWVEWVYYLSVVVDIVFMDVKVMVL